MSMRRAGAALLAAACAAGVPALPALAGDGQSPFKEEWFFAETYQVRKLEGQPAPELNVVSWVGEPVSIKQCRGRIVVLDLWAAWCGPCIRAMEYDKAIARDFPSKDVKLVAVHDAARAWEQAKERIAERQVQYSVGLDSPDEKDSTARRYMLEAWPTYVVIDRSGKVRAAGLAPEHVEDAVRVLLAEPWDAGAANKDEFPAECYLGGELRIEEYRVMEGKPAPELPDGEWIGTPGPLALKGDNATIVQFVKLPIHSTSMREFEHLRKRQPDLARMGVRLVAVCDRRSDWQAVGKAAEKGKWSVPVVRDAEPAPGSAFPQGRTAADFRPPQVPSTYVVDRDGVIRAAGIKAEMAVKVASMLLGVPEPPAEAPAQPPKAAGAK